MEKEIKFYTPKQVAEKLNLKPTTIREWCKRGKIGHIKFGKEYRISEKDLEEWVVKRKKQQEPESDLPKRDLLRVIFYLNLRGQGKGYVNDLYRVYKEGSAEKSIYSLVDLLEIIEEYDKKMPGLAESIFELLAKNGFLEIDD